MRPPEVASPADLSAIPDRPAVFLIWAREGKPYLARTSLLRRRLKRLLGEREKPSLLLSLRDVAERVEYWLTGSTLESSLLFHRLAKQHFPDDHRRLTRLRPPAYIRMTLSNAFPRTMITTKLGGRSLYYGPFRTRASAEQFEGSFLDLFQIRRCQEDLDPTPAHPGCIYGEMNLCLRPCQQVVTLEEYSTEVERATAFLESDGVSLLGSASAAREQASAELDFETAGRHHKWYERIEKALATRDDLAREISRLCGIAVTPSADSEAVDLWFMAGGAWKEAVRFALNAPEPMDHRLKSVAAGLSPPSQPSDDDLAILARWYYSSWRDGEWLAADSWDKLPYRRLVNAIARVAA